MRSATKVEAYAKLYDLELVEVIVDAGASAKTLDRPGLGKALGMLKSKKAEALLVVKLDRLTRSVRDLCDLVDTYFREGKSSLLCVEGAVDTRTAGGRMVLNMLTTIGQWEREAIGERTAVAMRHKASRGEYIGGGSPYGYRRADDGVHLVEEPAEQAILAEARKLRVAGMTLQAIARDLAGIGAVARSGRPFAPAQIARMVA